MARYYVDLETCGLHSVPVLLQYAIDNGPVILWDIWIHPILETMEIIEEIFNNDLITFNGVFDTFHLIKIYTMFSLVEDKSQYPEDIINELGIIEEQARFVDICLKPKRCLDIMLIARTTRYQSLMARDDLRIRRVPTALAWQLADELDRRIPFDEIYFARRKDPNTPKWRVYDIKRPDQTIHPDFKDVKLKFAASGGLKNLYRHAFRVKDSFFSYHDIEIDRSLWPKELGYAPFALAIARDYKKTGDWKGTWPEVIHRHIQHWEFNKDARTYAANDIIYTRRLAVEHFGNPEPGDVDSDLTAMVAAVRWRGYALDLDKVRRLKKEALLRAGFTDDIAESFVNRKVRKENVNKYGKAIMAPKSARVYVTQVMDETEKAVLQGSTKKVVLEEVATWMGDDGLPHPAAKRAREILDARTAQKEVELYDKLLIAGRFHASFKVVGTLSSRMAGADGLNAQGIKHTKDVRGAFTLADKPVFKLCGGDFKSFEVSLAATVFNDQQLTDALKSGVKVHGIMGSKLSGLSYEEVLKTEGMDPDWYDKGKKGFFLKCYFGEAYTFNQKLGVPMEVAEKANADFDKQFPNVKVFQDTVKAKFGALSQPKGLGTKVIWRTPDDYAESFLGFRRYFTLENRVMETLFKLAQDLPQSWKDIKIKVMRRERMQTVAGSISSSLYGSAFAIMGANIRAAGNHYIQSPGAMITKATQHNIWKVQPCGIHPWIVQPMNIHDEIMAPTRVGYENQVEEKARETVAFYKQQIPLLAIDWMKNISSWASKKGEVADDTIVSTTPRGSDEFVT